MATLSIPLTRAEMDDGYAVDVVKFEDGSEQRTLEHSDQLATWQCETPPLSSSEESTLRAFFAARYGGYESFTWTDPGTSTSHTVKFSDRIRWSNHAGGLRRSASFTLEKVPF